MMADLQKIGRALQGFGAGYNGQGAQFQRSMTMERESKQAQEKDARAQAIQTFSGAGSLFKQGDFEGAFMMLSQGDANAQQMAQELQNAAGDPDAMADIANDFERFDRMAIAAGELKGQDLASGTREFNAMTKGMSVEDTLKARRIELGLDARAVGSSDQTIAANGTSQQIADSQSVIKQGEESGKQKAILQFKPQIGRAVKLAESEASARGESLTDLKRMEATLPALTDAVGQLRELAPIATSTLGGRAFDAVVQQSGFGATTGKTARTKWIAIVANQVLPLLKQTFGGSFSVTEGAELKSTMGDPDSTIEEKMSQLDAFIDQKQRNIQSKQRELGQTETDFDLSDPTLSIDDLIKLRDKAQQEQGQ